MARGIESSDEEDSTLRTGGRVLVPMLVFELESVDGGIVIAGEKLPGARELDGGGCDMVAGL